ncbi:MAG: 2-phosphosulfolactate phosphatase [Pirellulales bacterium]
MKQLAVHYLPKLVSEHELTGATVVVIDLLRASTTICTALANGASEVRPFLEVADTLQAAEGLDRATLLLGGERGGRLIPGFDLGNSPAEYTSDRVCGKPILFSTTNGTRALQHARLAKRAIVGAIVNLSAVVDAVRNDPQVHILCAGTGGEITREDVLAAGAVASRLTTAPNGWRLTEPATSARKQWVELEAAAQTAGRSLSEHLAEELRRTPGGENLLAIGHDQDLRLCAQIDSLSVVPNFSPATGRITLP